MNNENTNKVMVSPIMERLERAGDQPLSREPNAILHSFGERNTYLLSIEAARLLVSKPDANIDELVATLNSGDWSPSNDRDKSLDHTYETPVKVELLPREAEAVYDPSGSDD